MVCRNICERICSKIIVGESHYSVGKKYCRRCECYFITEKVFCECCGMQLRTTPMESYLKQKMRDNLITMGRWKNRQHIWLVCSLLGSLFDVGLLIVTDIF